MKKKNIILVNKRNAISRDSLIIGIDIGSKFHSVVFQNKEGIVLDAVEILYNNKKGFDYLDKKIICLKKKHGLEDVHIGFEPTGYYWKKIIYHLSKVGYIIHFIRTTAVKSQRELDDSSSTKTDLTDANHIASIVREGKYIDSKILHGVFKNLRDIGKLRAGLMSKKTGMIFRLKMLVDMYFPEILDCFWSVNSKAFWNLIKVAPFPEDVNSMRKAELTDLLSVKGIKKERLERMVNQLKIASEASVGLDASEFDRYNLKQCIESLEMYQKQLKEIKKEMERLLNKTEYWELMKSIPGVGIVTGATLLGELGDPKNFKDAKSIIKFAGMDPKENSSGLYRSKSKISKKGRYLMRTMIYFISMRLIYRCKEFKEYYERKLKTKTNRGRYLEKKEALFAVGIKFIKILYAMLRDNKTYDNSRYYLNNIAA